MSAFSTKPAINGTTNVVIDTLEAAEIGAGQEPPEDTGPPEPQAASSRYHLVATTGPEWAARCVSKRSENKLFWGHDLCELRKLSAPEEIISCELKALNIQLRSLAKTPSGLEAVKKLFYDYFMGVRRLESMARSLGLGHVANEAERELEKISAKREGVLQDDPISAILAPKPPTPRHLMANELSKILAARYANGGEALPDQMLERVIKRRITQYKKIEREFEAELKYFLRRAQQIFESAVELDILPISQDVLRERLDLLRFVMLDELLDCYRNIYGSFHKKAHEVRISSAIFLGKHLFKTLVHEMIHALAGQMAWNKHDDSELMVLLSEPMPSKQGLSLTTRARFFNYKGPFLFWLDEAVTERLATKLLGTEDAFYKEEQTLLQLLIDNGIPEGLLYRAYFENCIPERKGPRLPALRELFDLTNERFGMRFLMKLDDKIRTRIEKGENKDDVIRSVHLELAGELSTIAPPPPASQDNYWEAWENHLKGLVDIERSEARRFIQ